MHIQIITRLKLEHGIGIAVFAEDAADVHADLRLGAVPQRPVNRHALADVRDQFPLDIFQRRFSAGGAAESSPR